MSIHDYGRLRAGGQEEPHFSLVKWVVLPICGLGRVWGIVLVRGKGNAAG